ncbi:MAG: adenylate/guanylate cyclase domain-containing protein [Cyanobacteriota bacterium]|nr:adenylate/guanylate cyclase domain-containing protein [Cyanobacteriota bacterium]
MQSHKDSGRIQVSAATDDRLGDRDRWEKRGEIDLKSNGTKITYWLLDRQI